MRRIEFGKVRGVECRKRPGWSRLLSELFRKREEMLRFKLSKTEKDRTGKCVELKEKLRKLIYGKPEYQERQKERSMQTVLKQARDWHKRVMEEARIARAENPMSRRDRIFSVVSMPAAKVLQLYGLKDCNKSARSVVSRTEEFKKQYPLVGLVSEVPSWSVICFSLTSVGVFLSKVLLPLGSIVADTIGYTVALVHPSLISLTIKKLMKKETEPGMAEYLQAAGIADIPASALFFGVFGSIIHGSSSASVSIARGISAALASSLMAFGVWAIGFGIYWTTVIRKHEGIGIPNGGIDGFVKGFVNPFRQNTAISASEEAGKIAGTGACVLCFPWYIVRAIAGALTAASGVSPELFPALFFSMTAILSPISDVLSGVKNILVNTIIERKNGGEQT
jgi:hypothetical protein